MTKFPTRRSHRTATETTVAGDNPTAGDRQFMPKLLPREERDAAKILAKKLPDDFSEAQVGERIDGDVAELSKGLRQNLRTARKIVGGCFDLYLFYAADKGRRLHLYKACADAGIKLTARMDLPTVVVRYRLRDLRPKPKPERLSRYTAVMRQAALDNIGPGKLTARLGTTGGSIKAMAKKFTDRNRKDNGPAPARLTLVCTEELRDKIEKYSAVEGCWLHVPSKDAGPLAVDKVRRAAPAKVTRARQTAARKLQARGRIGPRSGGSP